MQKVRLTEYLNKRNNILGVKQTYTLLDELKVHALLHCLTDERSNYKCDLIGPIYDKLQQKC